MTSPVKSASSHSLRRSIPAHASEHRWTAADGHVLRRIDYRHAPECAVRGAILFSPGRGDAYERWLETLEAWYREGWNVTSFDWRGQALSGRLGGDATTGHIEDFTVWLDDYAALYADWRANTPGPHVIVAHSMGGHIALRAVAEKRVRPDALVLSAPMLGLHPVWAGSDALHGLARGLVRLGDPRRPAWKVDDSAQFLPVARQALLTHDDARYSDDAHWHAERPDLRMGPPSWRWIERALASIRALEKPGMLESIDVPTLILATRVDRLVSYKAIRRAAMRIPGAELVTFGPECRHEILRETDPVRDRALRAIGRFLDRVVPARG